MLSRANDLNTFLAKFDSKFICCPAVINLASLLSNSLTHRPIIAFITETKTEMLKCKNTTNDSFCNVTFGKLTLRFCSVIYLGRRAGSL